MNEWFLEQSAPLNKPVLVWNGAVIAVGRKDIRGRWWIDESFGYNEDGEIPGVTHYMALPDPPENKET